MKHHYTRLEQRLRLALEYEHKMHRNYEVEDTSYHALLIAFMPSGAAYVVLQSNAVTKDRLILSLEDFDTVCQGAANDGTDRLSTAVQDGSGAGDAD